MEAHQASRTSSEQFKHGDTCGLFNPKHSIPSEIAAILSDLNESEAFKAVAGGCNGCTAPILESGVYYIAQHGNPDRVFFGYTDEAAAYALIGACVEHGVEYDWTGDTSDKVCVGSDDYF